MDEMVFDDVTYREPHKLRRPDRDPRYACLAYQVPEPGELPIFLDASAADLIERHALRDTTVELGGILLGKECVDDQTGEPFVWITVSLEAKHYENTQASFTYTHDSWQEITRERDRLYPDLDIVGWYHTHPDFGIFLSGMDLFIHRNYFNRPQQVAYVVDPINHTRGFFQWRGQDLAELSGYWIVADRNDRSRLARVVNDLEAIPNHDTSGSGISPRLEAELIAMLTRPAQPHQIVATQNSPLFNTFVGLALGVVAMLALNWVLSVSRHVQDQTAAINELSRSVERTSNAQRVAFDNLLGNEGKPVSTESIMRRYSETIKKVDEQSLVNSALASDLVRAREDLAQIKKEYDRAKNFEKDAKDLVVLKERYEKLRGDLDKTKERLSAQEEIIDVDAAAKSGVLGAKYTKAWYSAIVGWSLAILAGLGCLALWGSNDPNSGRLPIKNEPESLHIS